MCSITTTYTSNALVSYFAFMKIARIEFCRLNGDFNFSLSFLRAVIVFTKIISFHLIHFCDKNCEIDCSIENELARLKVAPKVKRIVS